MTFQDKLKSLRKEKDLSQEELAKKLNVSRSVVAKWETGIRLPKGELLESLAEVLGVNSEDLFDDKPSQEVIVKKTTVINRQQKVITGSICIIVILIVSLIIVLVSLKKTPTPNLVVHDNFNLLYEPVRNDYKKGDVVEIKEKALSGPRQGIFYNNTYIDTTVCDEYFTYCSAYFTMPSDQVEVYITRNGYTDNPYYDFSKEAWARADYSDRERLFNSFIHVNTLDILDKTDILAELGEPDDYHEIYRETYPVQYGGCQFYYYLSKTDRTQYIKFCFDSYDDIIDYKIQK